MRSSWVVVGARRHLCATFVNAGEALDADNVHATRMKVNPNPNPKRERERGQEVRANPELVSTAYASTFSDCVPASTPTATFMIDGFLLESLF